MSAAPIEHKSVCQFSAEEVVYLKEMIREQKQIQQGCDMALARDLHEKEVRQKELADIQSRYPHEVKVGQSYPQFQRGLYLRFTRFNGGWREVRGNMVPSEWNTHSGVPIPHQDVATRINQCLDRLRQGLPLNLPT